MSESDDPNPESNRRRLLKAALASAPVAALALPTRWTKPVVDSIIVPAHAATSPAVPPPPPPPNLTSSGSTINPSNAVQQAATGGPGSPPPGGTTSDVRLKTDIALLDRLPSGIHLYRFKYIGGDIDFVGVMAQQVRGIMPESVVEGPDGYLRVRYDALGLEMVSLSDWLDKQEAQGRA